MKQYDKRRLVSLSDQSITIILGSLLGDGSLRIHERYRNARFSFRHSVSQREYFSWKANALQEISSESCVFLQKHDGFSNNDKLRYQSLALEQLTELYNLTHEGKHLRIRRKWLNMMSPLSLAVWWCDDGSIVGNARKGVFCTDGFDSESVKLIANYLEKVWNIYVHIGIVGRKRSGTREGYYRMWLSTSELQKFLRIILPYIPVKSMLIKAILLYKDPQIQQRWISEVVKLSKFSRQDVEEVFHEKKRKWKHYRE